MQPLRHRINPQTFVITLRQVAKHLKIRQDHILNWEKWHNVLWVHIKGRGGYFVSYRKLEQWIAACRTLRKLLQKSRSSQHPLVSYCARSRALHQRSTYPTRSNLAATIHLVIQPSTNLAVRLTLALALANCEACFGHQKSMPVEIG